jgi:hypothetical protein
MSVDIQPLRRFVPRLARSERAGRLTSFAVVAALSLALWVAIIVGLTAIWP